MADDKKKDEGQSESLNPITRLAGAVKSIGDRLGAPPAKESQKKSTEAAIKALDARIEAARRAGNQDLIKKYEARKKALQKLQRGKD